MTKNKMISSAFSCLRKWSCCRKEIKRNESNKNLTMETKVTNDEDAATVTTIIECINDTKWSSMRDTKPNKDQNSKKLNFIYYFLTHILNLVRRMGQKSTNNKQTQQFLQLYDHNQT